MRINTKAVTAVRLGDGWHADTADFNYYGDGHSPLITEIGAVWMEKGFRFSCPLTAILAAERYTPI